MSKAYGVVKTFEEEIAKWAGAKYGVAVESCCAALFLSLKYLKPNFVLCPSRTYPGVPMAIANSGVNFKFIESNWKGIYNIVYTPIIDSALRFQKGMYKKGSFYCLSFHYKKLLPIGRGGMILTDDKDAYNWLKMARFDGRKEIPLSEDNAEICGWNMYMTPEQAARGLMLFELVKDKKLEDLDVKSQHYPDLSKWRCFNG